MKNFWKSEDGNFSIIAAAAILPCLVGVGVAIDVVRLHSLADDMQSAADSAALAGAVAYARSGEKAMKEEGLALLKRNGDSGSNLQIEDASITINDEYVVEVIVKAKTNPLVMNAFGHEYLNLGVASQATIGGKTGAEIAIALDATASMSHGSGWSDTVGTIENVLDDLKRLSEEDEFFLTLVPFQDRVNIGDSIQPSWTRKNGHFNSNNWDGCVEPRHEEVGDFDWMLTNEQPNKEKFEPTLKNTRFEHQTNRRVRCPAQPITGPTNDVDSVATQIRNIATNGTGRIDVGLAWAWRALTPEWKGQWGPKGYPFDPKDMKGKKSDPVPRNKYLIFLTDGRTQAYEWEAMNESSWGWNNGSQIAFEHIAEQCENIKADGIEIYMLQIPTNANATPYLKGCASSPEHYVVVDAPKDIEFAFKEIRNTLFSELRIMQ